MKKYANKDLFLFYDMQMQTMFEKRFPKEIAYIEKYMQSYKMREITDEEDDFDIDNPYDNYNYNNNYDNYENNNNFLYENPDDQKRNNYHKLHKVEIITPKQNRLLFTITKDYPFKPPVMIMWNEENYRLLLRNMPPRIYYLFYHPNDVYVGEQTRIHKHYTPECLCCKSLMCADNWSPVYMIHNILLEIEKHNGLKRSIRYKLQLKEIFDHATVRLPLELIRNVYGFLHA